MDIWLDKYIYIYWSMNINAQPPDRDLHTGQIHYRGSGKYV